MKKSIFRRLCKLNRMAAPLAPKGELNRSIRTLGRDGLASDAQGNANTVAHLCMKVKPQSNSVRGSFTAKTLLRGNPAGSVVPFGHAALGISTLSSPRSGLRRPGERKTERAAAKPQTFHGYRTPLRGGGWGSGKPTRRETEGGGRGQRRSRRATDGARSGSRLPWRLCGLQCGLLQASKRPSFQ